MATASFPTIGDMTKPPTPTKTKGLPRDMNLRARRLLKEQLERDFGDLGKNGWQPEAAKRTGLSKSELSELVRIDEHPSKGVGASQLVRISAYLGRTINDILGMEPLSQPTSPEPTPPGQREMADDFERTQLAEVKRRQGTPPTFDRPPPPFPRKRPKKKHRTLVEQKHVEARVEQLRHHETFRKEQKKKGGKS